jgi:DNA-binding MarR family transcriptional regulator
MERQMEKLLIEFVNTFDLSLKKFRSRAENDFGISRLTISQLQYIDAIHLLGEPSITEIAGSLNFTKASVTASVNKLMEMGFLIKSQSVNDKRVFNVHLTDAGNKLILAKYQALKEYEEFIVSVLSIEESRQFEAILTKLVTLFHKLESGPNSEDKVLML